MGKRGGMRVNKGKYLVNGVKRWIRRGKHEYPR